MKVSRESTTVSPTLPLSSPSISSSTYSNVNYASSVSDFLDNMGKDEEIKEGPQGLSIPCQNEQQPLYQGKNEEQQRDIFAIEYPNFGNNERTEHPVIQPYHLTNNVRFPSSISEDYSFNTHNHKFSETEQGFLQNNRIYDSLTARPNNQRGMLQEASYNLLLDSGTQIFQDYSHELYQAKTIPFKQQPLHQDDSNFFFPYPYPQYDHESSILSPIDNHNRLPEDMQSGDHPVAPIENIVQNGLQKIPNSSQQSQVEKYLFDPQLPTMLSLPTRLPRTRKSQHFQAFERNQQVPQHRPGVMNNDTADIQSNILHSQPFKNHHGPNFRADDGKTKLPDGNQLYQEGLLGEQYREAMTTIKRSMTKYIKKKQYHLRSQPKKTLVAILTHRSKSNGVIVSDLLKDQHFIKVLKKMFAEGLLKPVKRGASTQKARYNYRPKGDEKDDQLKIDRFNSLCTALKKKCKITITEEKVSDEDDE